MSNIFNGVLGILMAISPNYVALLVFRFLHGLGVKGGWVTGYVLSKDKSPLSCYGLHSVTGT